MPISPNEEPTAEEGLNQDGETAEEMEEVGSKSDEEEEEGRTSKGQKPPKEPTRVEREEHERTHCPYRNWCKHCVKSRARNSPHRNSTPEEPLEELKVPRVHLDYLLYVQRRREGVGESIVGNRR